MDCLKIIKTFDLKELEKSNFILDNIIRNDEVVNLNNYLELIWYTCSKKINNKYYSLDINCKTRIIKGDYLSKLYDLIQLGIIEKGDE